MTIDTSQILVETNADKATASILMTHDIGLHARPSVSLTKLAKKFASKVEIGTSSEGPWVDAKSIARVMKMKAPTNTVLHFKAEGVDAENAVRALAELVENDFAIE